MTTTESTPCPSANTISGARAMIGIVWLAMTYGTNARSASREWTNTVARPSPSRLPEHEPDERLAPGVERGPDEVLEQRLRRRRAGTAGPSRTTMFQTWGRLRSFANAQRNGGFHRIGEPGSGPGGAPRRRRPGT